MTPPHLPDRLSLAPYKGEGVPDRSTTSPALDAALYLATMLALTGASLMILTLVIVARHQMTLPLTAMALVSGVLACALCRSGVKMAWRALVEQRPD